MKKRIILFGGSFDPIHNGHLNIANRMKDKLAAEQVIFILTKNPRWKKNLTPVEHRLNMLNLAIQNYSNFMISTYELESKFETNYTVDTVRYFKKKFPNDDLYFLLGYDQLEKLHEWKNIEEIVDLVKIISYGRLNVAINQSNTDKYNVLLVDDGLFNISSTEIREMKKIDVPTEVLKYILDNNLYFLENISKWLSGARFEHSKSVAWLAHQIALRNGLNEHSALVAGLLHDIGKEVPFNKSDNIMNDHFKAYLSMPVFAHHQFVGRYIAEHEFGVKDEEVLQAIEFHATGSDHLSPLAMIIYASDKIEPLRGFDSSDLICACLNDFYSGFQMVLAANREYLENHEKNIDNPLTTACFKKYLKAD